MAKFLNNFKGKILYTDRMEDAVAFAFVNTEKDKICLLSTASPSYSVWKNFEEKGDLFKASIKKIAEENTLPKKEDDRWQLLE